jgi:hypothetical protein
MTSLSLKEAYDVVRETKEKGMMTRREGRDTRKKEPGERTCVNEKFQAVMSVIRNCARPKVVETVGRSQTENHGGEGSGIKLEE